MKTVLSSTPAPARGAGTGLAGGLGTQLAALLLAVLVTPSTLPVRDLPHAPAAQKSSS
jgi:hypothetical protein